MSGNQVNVYDRFVDFLAGHQAAVDLLERAQDHKSPIEFVVLAASVIDAFLREALVYEHQIKTQSMAIPESLVYQQPRSSGISERGIYMKARDARVISPELFKRLSDLYDDRSAVVHRYIITAITTERVLEIAAQYEEILEAVQAARDEVSTRLMNAGCGTVVEFPEDLEMVDAAALDVDIEEPKLGTVEDKHGSSWVKKYLGKEDVDKPPSSKP